MTIDVVIDLSTRATTWKAYRMSDWTIDRAVTNCSAAKATEGRARSRRLARPRLPTAYQVQTRCCSARSTPARRSSRQLGFTRAPSSSGWASTPRSPLVTDAMVLR